MAVFKDRVHLGLEVENHFFYSVTSMPEEMKPPWLKGFRQASPEEDRRGADVFAELDVGVVPIDVKRSHHGLAKYVSEHPGKDAIVFVAPPGSHEMDIRTSILELLSEWREARLSAMRRWKPQWNSILARL